MLTLHPLLVDDAVLQCEKSLVITGTASPGARVSVRFAAVTGVTNASQDGSWSVHLAAFPPGGPHYLVASSGPESLSRKGILMGEVWLCSGQSNMEWTLGMLKGLESEIAVADDPFLRCFTVARTIRDEPMTTLSGVWQAATAQHVRDFSATAYFFARRIRAATNHPVGIVVSAYGGTKIAAWLPRETLERRAQYRHLLPSETDGKKVITQNFAPHPFEKRAVETAGWEATVLEETEWAGLPVPGYWQQQGWQHNGAVWYRCTLPLPASWVGRELVLQIGSCDDFDETFVNGVFVGSIGPESPSAYATRRVYSVPAPLVNGSWIVVAIRVFDHWGNGGITGGVWLQRADLRGETISLNGLWKARVEKPLPLRAPSSDVPAVTLYNGMIHPLIGYGLRGFLWYQGESDVQRAALYRLLLPDLIAAWRDDWNDENLPFGIVQLANHQIRSADPMESELAELRDAQLLTVRSVSNTGLAVTIDVGEADDIHPRKKAPVGERLARWALATVYNRSISPWSSPLPTHHWVEAEGLCVQFNHVGTGLRSRGGVSLQGFQITDASRQWRWAEAVIVQSDVVKVRSAGIVAPVAVRYAWQANPLCTLENSEGLPASPFRTDDWSSTPAMKS